MYNRDFWQRVKYTREKKRIDKETLTREINVSKERYVQLENGNTRSFKLDELIDLSKALDCSLDYLITGDETYNYVREIQKKGDLKEDIKLMYELLEKHMGIIKTS